MKPWLVLLLFLALCFVVAAIGGALTNTQIHGWYATIKRPSFNPPDWIFGPVWTTLYAMMAVAAWLVWRRRGDADVTPALVLFGVQLAFNLAWSGFFFAMRNPGLALIDLILLWISILLTIVFFFRLSTVAGWLMLPYILWVSFAGVLNFEIWRLNR